jgi:hypothetical protein
MASFVVMVVALRLFMKETKSPETARLVPVLVSQSLPHAEIPLECDA